MALNRNGMHGVAQAVFSDMTSAADQRRAEHAFCGRYLSRKFNNTDIGTTTNVSESPAFKMKYAGTVLNTCFTPSVNYTANTTNYATFSLNKSTGGAASTVIATMNTATVNLTALVPQPLTLNATGVQYAAGDVLTMTVLKFGAGGATFGSATTEVIWDVDVDEGY